MGRGGRVFVVSTKPDDSGQPDIKKEGKEDFNVNDDYTDFIINARKSLPLKRLREDESDQNHNKLSTKTSFEYLLLYLI